MFHLLQTLVACLKKVKQLAKNSDMSIVGLVITYATSPFLQFPSSIHPMY